MKCFEYQKLYNQTKKIFLSFLLIILFPFLTFSQTKEVCIAVTSDIHGVIFPWDYTSDMKNEKIGFSKVVTVINQIKKDNPSAILIDIGDSYQGNCVDIFLDMKVHPMIQALNYANYDLWVFGNHDFNFGLDVLNKNLKGFNGDVTSANIKLQDSGKNFVLPYKIFKKDGVRVAVIGLTSSFVPHYEQVNPEHYKNLIFEDPLVSAKKTVQLLNGKYDILIGAFHIGKNNELSLEGKSGVVQIAEQVSEFNVLFSGHDHSSFCEKINNTYVLGCGTRGSQVSFAKIQLEKQNGSYKIANIVAKNILTKDYESSKQFEKKFSFIHKKAREYANQVIGYVTEDFISQGADYITGKDEIVSMPRAQIEPTAITDFLNDVVMYYSKAEISETQLLSMNANLKKGDFKRKDVQMLFPYNNYIVGVKVSGKNLLALLEKNAEYFQMAEERDVTIAFNSKIRAYSYSIFKGINYEIDISKPVGQRIKNVTINGKPINPNASYKFGTSDYRFNFLKENNYVTDNDIYFNSITDLQNSPDEKELLLQYIVENLKGKITQKCDNNWKIIGLPSSFNDSKTLEKIKSGEITIPFSFDGRTPNVEKVKVNP